MTCCFLPGHSSYSSLGDNTVTHRNEVPSTTDATEHVRKRSFIHQASLARCATYHDILTALIFLEIYNAKHNQAIVMSSSANGTAILNVLSGVCCTRNLSPLSSYIVCFPI